MDGYDLMLITNEGIVIRLDADKLPNLSRVTQGVKLINLKDSQKVSSIALIKKEDENSSDIEFNEEKYKLMLKLTKLLINKVNSFLIQKQSST